VSVRRNWKVLLTGLSALLALIIVLAGASLYVLQTSWFKRQVRSHIVSTVERASGGRVELKSFTYNWRSLTAELQGFVLRGSEPPDAPPLFRADRIRIGFRIVSFFQRKIDLDSIVIDSPRAYVLVRPDGSTNIPARRDSNLRRMPQELIDLGVRRFQLNHGIAQLNAKQLPLNLRGEDLRTGLRYVPSQSLYRGTLSSRNLRVASGWAQPVTADIRVTLAFGKDHAEMESLALAVGRSKLEGTAVMHHFASPSGKFQLRAAVDAPEVAQLLRAPGVRSGNVQLAGAGAFDSNNHSFTGTVTGQDLGYRKGRLAIARAGLRSEVSLTDGGLFLKKLVVNALGAKLSGEAELPHFRQFHLTGRVEGLAVREAARFLTDRPLPWSGALSGPVEVETLLSSPLRDLKLTATARISPGKNGVPISGSIPFSYNQRAREIRLGDSHVLLPHSTLAISGTPSQLDVALDTSDLDELKPALDLVSGGKMNLRAPVSFAGGNASFKGTVTGPLATPAIAGTVNASSVRYRNILLDTFRANVRADRDSLSFTDLSLSRSSLHASASGHVGLTQWTATPGSPVHLQLTFRDSGIAGLAPGNTQLTQIHGLESGSLTVNGTIGNPSGSGRISAKDVEIRGEHVDSILADVQLAGNRLIVQQGTARAGGANLSYSLIYEHLPGSWTRGALTGHLDSNNFSFASLRTVHAYDPGLSGRLQVHAQGAVEMGDSGFAIRKLDGNLHVSDVVLDNVPYGSMSLSAHTEGKTLDAAFTGRLRNSRFDGSGKVWLTGDYRTEGSLNLEQIELSSIVSLLPEAQRKALNQPFEGVLQGGCSFHGPLAKPGEIGASIRLETVELKPKLGTEAPALPSASDLVLRNSKPILIDIENRVANIHSAEFTGNNTKLDAKGRIALNRESSASVAVDGAVNLQILRLLDPNLRSAGIANVHASVAGALINPAINGSLDLRDASFSSATFSNGLDHANGLIRFDRNRATIQNLTAESGGGKISMTGFATFGGGVPMVYRLEADASDVRLRHNGVSVTFNADLHYTGTSQKSLFSGDVTVTKAAFNPNTDVGNLFAESLTAGSASSSANSFLQNVRLEINVGSAPSLELATSLGRNVEAEINLRLRGTPDRPAVLGGVSLNQGQIQLFGNKYTINRGEVNFFNPVKIEPTLDLDLQTQARGVTVNITITGSMDKLNVSYRSDPPLQSGDIIALLATGRAPGQTSTLSGTQGRPQAPLISTGASALLGSAISPNSSRLQRFFGVTHLKIDPMLQGVEDVPQARLTLEQQISRQVTITYVTNLSRTAEQIFRFEWALNREYSLVAIRDENGLFGVDIQYKKRFK
jgi:translocation and assembly module TamB